MCTLMFIAAILMTAKRQKQSKYPLVDEWVNKMWCIHTVKYYSPLKKDILTYAIIWMKLETITFSEICQSQKEIYCMIY